MCYILRADKSVLDDMVKDFCSFRGILTLDKEKLAGKILPSGNLKDVFEIEIDGEVTENLLFYVIDSPRYKGKYFTDYPLNKVIGFVSRSSLERAIDSFNKSRPDYYIDGSADDANFVRSSSGIVYEVPVDNYFLANMLIDFAKKDGSLSSFMREGYERV